MKPGNLPVYTGCGAKTGSGLRCLIGEEDLFAPLPLKEGAIFLEVHRP